MPVVEILDILLHYREVRSRNHEAGNVYVETTID